MVPFGPANAWARNAISVPRRNLPPNAQNDTVHGACIQFTLVNLTANDSDPDGNYPLSLLNVSYGAGGFASATIISSSIVKVSFGDTAGLTQLNYTVQDALGATDTGLLEVWSNQCIGGEIPP